MNEDRLADRLSSARGTLNSNRGHHNDQIGDVVVGVVARSSRVGIEVRLRDLQTLGKCALIRTVKKDQHGNYSPLESGSLSGITITAAALSATIDALELAEDALADEGLLP